jgi:hypothetical protein
MAFETNLETAAESADDLPSAEAVLSEYEDEIPLRELFSDEFVAAYTDFDTFDEMVAASPSDAASAEELGLVPDGTWDEFVAERTAFDDETEMVMAVRDYWVAEKLGL